MHTRVYSLPFFLFLPLSLSRLSFSVSFPGSSSLAPFSSSLALSLSLSHSVLRNTHATSTLKRARALHPLHRDVLSKIQPLFQPGRPMGRTPAPVVSASGRIHRRFRYSSFDRFEIPFVSLYAFLSRTISLSSGHFRRALAQMFSLFLSLRNERIRLSASFGCLPWLPGRTVALILSSSSSRNIPADITTLFQFRPNFPECCQFLNAVVVHNITFAVLKGSRYS